MFQKARKKKRWERILLLKSSAFLFVLLLYILFFSQQSVSHAQSLSNAVADHRAKLLQELSQLETEINGYQVLINTKRQEAQSLERDISILDTNIKKTKLEIRAIDLAIATLQDKIDDKEISIGNITTKVNREKISLGELLRTTREYDDISSLEVLLSHDRISDFLDEADSVATVQTSIQNSFDSLRTVKKLEETVRDELVDRKQEKGQLRAVQDIQRRQLEKDGNERKNLLKVTRGKESEYKKIQANKQKSAASIRSQLFLLQGSPAIPFEKAALYAERASQKTGVRVAFVLGIIAQESELGSNIGQCNLPGDPPNRKWDKIMKPSRDQKPYLDITSRLGLDPNLMPLSCPLSVGWGGAMGPAQFIPSTWVLYEAKISAQTGHTPPNPWSPEDAFMASAIYLGELGAHTQTGERIAAAKYFAGGSWNTALGRSYANQVLAKVENYQDQLNIIQGVALR